MTGYWASTSQSERDRRDLAALADGALGGRRLTCARGAPSRARRTCARASAASGARSRGLQGGRGQRPGPAAGRARLRAVGAIGASPIRAGTAWAGAAAALAAVAVAIVVLAGGAPSPTIDETRAPHRCRDPPAPTPRADQPTLLTAEAEGLAYPNWAGEFGWRASGERADRLGDREATTVYYDKDGGQIAYTIVSGSALERSQVPRRRRSTGSISPSPATAPHGRHLAARWPYLRALGRRRPAPEPARARRLEGRRGGRVLAGVVEPPMMRGRASSIPSSWDPSRPPLPGGARDLRVGRRGRGPGPGDLPASAARAAPAALLRRPRLPRRRAPQRLLQPPARARPAARGARQRGGRRRHGARERRRPRRLGSRHTRRSRRWPPCSLEYRDGVVAVDSAGLSYREAARALGTREGTIMSRLHRGRERVAEALGG